MNQSEEPIHSGELPRQKRSVVWKYFQINVSKDVATCKICDKGITIKYGNTSNLMSHLCHKHHKEYYEIQNERREIERSVSSSSLTDSSLMDDEDDPETDNVNIRREIQRHDGQPSSSTARPLATRSSTFNKMHQAKSGQTKLDKFRLLDKKTTERFTNSITKFICMDMMPYSIVENVGFRRMIRELQPNYVLPSRTTFSENKVPSLYHDVRAKVSMMLKDKNYVALTTDCWTSAVMDPYIAVTAHFINNRTWKMTRVCLACRKLDADHTAEILRDSLLDIISEWNVEVDRVSGCTTDNASNILECMRLLKWNHVSCFGHTLNIGINKAFKSSHISDIIKKARLMQNSIAHSWQLKRNLKAIQKRLNLPEHSIPSICETRWWSILRLLKLVVSQHLALVTLFTETEKSKYRNLSLTASEIHLLTRIIDVLEPLEALCEHMCGDKFVTSSSIWPVYSKLKDILGDKSLPDTVEPDSDVHEEAEETAFLNEIKSVVLSPLQDRYEKEACKNFLEKVTFLDPRFKLDYTCNRETVVDTIISDACTITDTFPDPSQDSHDIAEPHSKKTKLSGLAAILKPKTRVPAQARTKTNIIIEEVETYAKASLIDMNADPLAWWGSHSSDFPNLSLLAKKYLCIPGSSVPSERVFSCAGNIVTDTRSCLTSEHVEQLIFLAMNKDVIE